MDTLEGIVKSGATAAVVVVWLAAVSLVVWGSNQLRVAVANDQRVAEQQALVPPSIKISDQEVSRAEYQEAAKTIANLHPDLDVDGERGALAIRAKDLGAYYTWQRAMFDALVSIPDARWEVKSLCAGADCREAAYMVELVAKRKKIETVVPST